MLPGVIFGSVWLFLACMSPNAQCGDRDQSDGAALEGQCDRDTVLEFWDEVVAGGWLARKVIYLFRVRR
jgi:hypothetical protein